VGFEPQRTSGGGRINASFFPPAHLVATAVDLAMVPPAERYCELVAYFATQCPLLGKAHMMRISRLTAADQARLFGDEPDMVAVANPARLGIG
jgi:hypothetical protein